MSIDNTTYNFCIESLRYIHKMIGYNNIIKELNFIQHLHTSNKSESVPEHVANAMLGLDDMTDYDYNSESEKEAETKDNNKNIVIETKNNKNKYIRTELPDEKRCEFILPTTKRCTFKKADNSNNCSRHSKSNT
jgi:hypothetical protein